MTKKQTSGASAISQYSSGKKADTKSREKSQLSNFPLLYIAFVLKLFSDKNHPLAVSDIAERLGELFPNLDIHKDSLEKKIRRQLKKYFDATSANIFYSTASAHPDPASFSEGEEFLTNILILMLGGIIKSALWEERPPIQKNRNAHKNQKYYFLPLLDGTDVSLIENSIITNRHFHTWERDYLLDRMELLLSPRERAVRENGEVLSLYDINILENFNTMDMEIIEELLENISPQIRPKEDVSESYKKILNRQISGQNGSVAAPAHQSSTIGLLSNRNFLNHINALYHAIRKKQMVDIVYGRYTREERSGKETNLSFEVKSNGKRSALNPYALLWNSGQLYLIATHRGHTNPVHYRVDRIILVEPHFDRRGDSPDAPENKTGSRERKIPQKREPVPRELLPYFDRETFQNFDHEKYIAEHPLMGAYLESAKKIKCTLRTTERGLGLLYDYFGNSFSIRETEGMTDDSNINREPLPLFDVTIKNVCDDNMLLFCVRHHDMVTVLEPETLRIQVIERLKKSLENLSQPARISSTRP